MDIGEHGPKIVIGGALIAAVSGITAAVITFVSGGLAYYTVPPQYAALTQQQVQIRQLALRYGPGSGIYYIWGGSSPYGFDCSGFVGYVYRRAGISVPRTTYAQWADGGYRVPAGQLAVGDAVYFGGSYGSYGAPGHMGLYIGNGEVIDYYSSGHPARRQLLSRFRGFVGAKRWFHTAAVPKRDFGTAIFVASHWGIKISGSKRDKVYFKATPTGGAFTWKKWNALRKWARGQRHKYEGSRKSYLAITLWPRPAPKPAPKTNWDRVQSTALWVQARWGVRLKSHRPSGLATYIPAKGRSKFRVATRASIVRWAHHQGHMTSGNATFLNVMLWPPKPHTYAP